MKKAIREWREEGEEVRKITRNNKQNLVDTMFIL
jgi:hypothetical protein